jgi:hypothetical protein
MKEKKVVFRIFLPDRYNDGTHIEFEKYDWVRDELLRTFGGFSEYYHACYGYWKNPATDRIHNDLNTVYEVVCEDDAFRRHAIKVLKDRLKKVFDQIEIFITKQSIEVI